MGAAQAAAPNQEQNEIRVVYHSSNYNHTSNFYAERKPQQHRVQTIQVAFGDTYWGIAKELQEAGYRPWADIRDVVHELVEMSGIPAHELREGDIIYIPDLKTNKEVEGQ